MDIHALTAEDNQTAGYHNAGVKMKSYDIPLRALIARDVDGLQMAGRCISGEFKSHASYRVTGNAVAMGEAAGAAAAIAVKNKTAPHDVRVARGAAGDREGAGGEVKNHVLGANQASALAEASR